MIGRIKTVVPDKGFFFIGVPLPGGTSVDFFAHRSSLVGDLRDMGQIQKGQLVTFLPVNNGRGPRAEEVRIIPADIDVVEGPEATDPPVNYTITTR